LGRSRFLGFCGDVSAEREPFQEFSFPCQKGVLGRETLLEAPEESGEVGREGRVNLDLRGADRMLET